MKEWKDNSFFKKYDRELSETEESLKRLVKEGKVKKEFSKARNEWVYTTTEKGIRDMKNVKKT